MFIASKTVLPNGLNPVVAVTSHDSSFKEFRLSSVHASIFFIPLLFYLPSDALLRKSFHWYEDWCSPSPHWSHWKEEWMVLNDISRDRFRFLSTTYLGFVSNVIASCERKVSPYQYCRVIKSSLVPANSKMDQRKAQLPT